MLPSSKDAPAPKVPYSTRQKYSNMSAAVSVTSASLSALPVLSADLACAQVLEGYGGAAQMGTRNSQLIHRSGT